MSHDATITPLDVTEDIIRFPRSPEAPAVTDKPPHARIDREALRRGGHLVPGDRDSRLANVFRHIRNAVLKATLPENGGNASRNLLMVTSTQSDEGKTFCAINLALAIAGLEELPVLLIDANTRRPDVASRLGISEEKGLANLLADPALSLDSVTVRTDIPGLSVIPAGPAERAAPDGWASRRMRIVVDEMVRAHPSRIVIFDTPPVLECSSTSLIADFVGQALFVVGAGQTRRRMIDRALVEIQDAGDIRMVVNRR